MIGKEKIHLKYRRDIDGLRAIAVLFVILFHAFPNFLPGGFIGVDIFFVISGYLISSIIFQNLQNNSFDFIDFYSLRIRRIFPSLLATFGIAFLLGWNVLSAGEFSQLGKHIASGAFLYPTLHCSAKVDILMFRLNPNLCYIYGLWVLRSSFI